MIEEAGDTIYQGHYVSKEKLTRLQYMKDDVRQNPTKDLVDHKGSDVSISTQPEYERMWGYQIIEKNH